MVISMDAQITQNANSPKKHNYPRTVHVTIDRPLGSRHPGYQDMIYEVNYGYVDGILGGDGEWQDAYVLGIDKAIEEFDGEVIAVIRRLNDNEEKWVVAPNGITFTDEEILRAVSFQEKYFSIRIER